jgi:hypothetical protein
MLLLAGGRPLQIRICIFLHCLKEIYDMGFKSRLLVFSIRNLFIAVLLLCCTATLRAQQNIPPHRDSVTLRSLSDSMPKKRFGRATWELMLIEAIPWAFDRYAAQEDWAMINSKTISYNVKPSSWAWDEDDFITNQLAHPAHGSIFFNAFRSNGYTFWESVPASFAGSYIWETLAETQAPSINDFVNTGFGGVIIGETTHRLANRLVNSHVYGVRRQLNEILALVLNPVDGFNRIIDGKWGKPKPSNPDTRRGDTSNLTLEFAGGWRQYKVNRGTVNSGRYAHLGLIYGSPFEDIKTPFSTIFLNAEFGKDDSTAANMVTVYGSLTGWRIAVTDSSRHNGLLTANYDYLNTAAFFYSGQSVNFNLFSRFRMAGHSSINTIIYGGAILLAAVPDPYLYKGRSYDYCVGTGYGATFAATIRDQLSVSLHYAGGWFSTVSGNSSYYFLHTLSASVNYRLVDQLYLGAEPGYYALWGRYRYNPNVNSTYPFFRIFLKYALNL